MEIKRPMIGVIPLVDEERESYWMLPGYMKALEQAGAIPVMLPLTVDGDELGQLARTMDGFLFTGGQDVSPEIYGEAAIPECGAPCRERDMMEQLLLSEALKLDKPILGICRGIQFINAALGGTLYQDLPSMHPSETEHHQCAPYDVPVHRVSILENTPLFELLRTKELAVNSYHHQAVRKPASRLSVMAISEDGLAEAVYMPDKRFVWAVQWHPEFSYEKDEAARKIFAAFAAACNKTIKETG